MCRRVLVSFLALLTLLTGAVSVGLGNAAGQGDVQGVPSVGAPGVQRTTAELNAAAGTPKVRLVPLFRGPRQKTQAGTGGAPVPTAPQVPVGGRTLSATLSFTGTTASESGVYPPDSEGDIGPSQFLMAVNGRVKVFDKATGVVGALNTSLNGFFSAVLEPSATSGDPRVRFDRVSNRWFVTAISAPPSFASNRILIGVSDGPTITNSTVWTLFQFQHDLISGGGDSGLFADFPTLGVDANALYIGADMFTSSGSFVQTSGYVVRKSSLLSGGPIVVTAFRDFLDGSFFGLYAPQGVDDLDPAGTQGYFVGVDAALFSRLNLRRVSNPGGTPSISSNIPLDVASTSFANTPGISVFGSSKPLDTIDDRLSEAVIRNGTLFVAQNIGVDASGNASSASNRRTASRWYEIGNLATSPTVTLFGTVFESSGSNPLGYWMPSIGISGQGHALLGMSAGGLAARPQGATATMLSGQTSFSTPQAYVGSSANYNPALDTGSAYRWGDYSRTSVDPCDDQTFWTIQEFVAATDVWGVQIAKVSAPPPASPSSASPVNVLAGQASVSVSLTGTSSGGSGFFDTGSGTCRINASSSGLTVNSVTFVDATHVTLGLSTVGATVGPKTVAVTNPDGQTNTSTGTILNIVQGPVSTAPPQVLGSPVVGSTLGADPGSWSAFPSPTFGYQWKKCNSSGASCVDIGAATGSTYVPVVADVGSVVRVNVTASNAFGTASALSASRSPTDTLIRPRPGSR